MPLPTTATSRARTESLIQRVGRTGRDDGRPAVVVIGVDDPDDDTAQLREASDIARACLDRGLVVNGVTPTALRLAPPFIVTDEQIAEGVEIIGAAIAEGAA